MSFEQEFEKWKEEFLSPYCLTKCTKMCCDMNNVSLYVYRDELLQLFDGKVDFENLGQMGIKAHNVRNIFSLETKAYCPKFDPNTRRCTDYARRPKSCREYPFVVEKDSITVKTGCPLGGDSAEFKKLSEIAARHGKVMVKRHGK